MFTNKFLAITLLVIAAAMTAESVAPEQEFEVAYQGSGSSAFVELQAYTPQLLENVIALKAYCMAASLKVKADKSMKMDKNAILAKFVLAFGKKPETPKGPKYDLHTMSFVRRQHKPANVIMDYARVMGTMRAKYTKGLGKYLFANMDKSLLTATGATVTHGAQTMFSHKALGFTHLPKYVVAMAVSTSSVTQYSVYLTKINKSAMAEASRRAIEKREKAARAKAKAIARKKAAAHTKQALKKAAAEKKTKAAKSTAKQTHEANRKSEVNELLKKAEAKRLMKSKHMEQKRKVARIKRAKKHGHSVNHLVKKEKSEKAHLHRQQGRENDAKQAARRAAAKSARRKAEAKRAAARRAASRKADARRAEQAGERRRKDRIKQMKAKMKKRFAEKTAKMKKKMAAKIKKLKVKAQKEAAAKKKKAAAKEKKKKAANAAAKAKAKKAASAKTAAEKKFKAARSEKAKKIRFAKMKVAKAKAKAAKARAQRAARAKAKANRKKAAAAKKEKAAKAKAKAGRHAKRAPSQGSSPIVYQHCNFGGYRKVLHHSTDWVRKMGVKNDDLSSIKVPAGKCVVLYQHAHYKGKAWKICGKTEVKCFVHHKMLGNKSWNDQVSSIKVINAPKWWRPPPKKMDGSRRFVRHVVPKRPAPKKMDGSRRFVRHVVPKRIIRRMDGSRRIAPKLKRLISHKIKKIKKATKIAKGKKKKAAKNVAKKTKKLVKDTKKAKKAKAKEQAHKVRLAKAKKAAAKRRLRALRRQKARVRANMRRAKIICHRANMAARELKAKTKAKTKAKATYGSGAHVAETLFVQVAHHKASNKRTASYRARLVHVLRLKRACTKALHARSFAVSTSRRNRARARAERANKARVIKRLNAKAAAKKKLAIERRHKEAAKKRLRTIKRQKARAAWQMRRARKICHHAKMAAHKLKHHVVKKPVVLRKSKDAAEAMLVQVMHHKAKKKTHHKTKKKKSSTKSRAHHAKLVRHVRRLKHMCTKALHAHAHAVAKSRRQLRAFFAAIN